MSASPNQIELSLPARPADEIIAERRAEQLSAAIAGYTRATTSEERDRFARRIRELRAKGGET